MRPFIDIGRVWHGECYAIPREIFIMRMRSADSTVFFSFSHRNFVFRIDAFFAMAMRPQTTLFSTTRELKFVIFAIDIREECSLSEFSCQNAFSTWKNHRKLLLFVRIFLLMLLFAWYSPRTNTAKSLPPKKRLNIKTCWPRISEGNWKPVLCQLVFPSRFVAVCCLFNYFFFAPYIRCRCCCVHSSQQPLQLTRQ